MKRVYLVHGWSATSKSDFFPWLKSELEKRKIWSNFLDMPNNNKPKIKEWTNFLKKNIKDLDEETILIGHSIGCQTILRFLETLPSSIKVKKVILVAPWMKLDEETIKEEGEEVIKIAKPWEETPINYSKVKIHSEEFVCIFSDNDPFVPLLNEKLLKENLNAKSVILKGRYHFDEGNGISELPEILNFITK